MNELKLNISSSPHFRQKTSTGGVMMGVVLSLMPATIFGVYHFGMPALLIILCSICSALLSEAIYCLIAKKPLTITDGSAVVTGLLLALSLSPSVPLYVPIVGSAFAILVVKCFFGGLGKNFMNPALAARCFLLISFGTQMTAFKVDGVSAATPLAVLKAGDTVNVASTYLGFTNSVIGGSALMLLIGGLLLWVFGGITMYIPASTILTFTVFMALFGGKGLSIPFLLENIFAGGILMGAFFMATDPVTSPVTKRPQIIFGIIVGLLAGLFRVKGASADSVSYSIIIANMFVPFLDKMPVHKPLGYNVAENKHEFPKSAVNLCAITLVAGLALSGVYAMTKDTIAIQQMNANAEAYRAVLSEAAGFDYDDAITAALAECEDPYDSSSFGRTVINEVVVGKNDAGEVAGYVISVTTHEGFDGDITMAVGIQPDGTVEAISFTELNETAGMGMKAQEPAFKDQFNGVNTDAFTLNKSGDSTEANDIDTIAGASTTSGAVINAVNTALDFFAKNMAS